MGDYHDHGDSRPHPRENPKAVIREELGEHREVLEVLADMDLDELSEDAEKALAILDETTPEEPGSDGDSAGDSVCSACGDRVGTGDEFCRHCGEKLPGGHGGG